MWNKKLRQVVDDIYWWWMSWMCLILIWGDDIGRCFIWVLLWKNLKCHVLYFVMWFFKTNMLKLTQTFILVKWLHWNSYNIRFYSCSPYQNKIWFKTYHEWNGNLSFWICVFSKLGWKHTKGGPTWIVS